VHPAWIVRFHDSVNLDSESDEHLAVQSPSRRVVLQQLPAGFQAVFGLMKRSGATLERLVELAKRVEGEAPLARFFYHLQNLTRCGLVVFVAHNDRRRLATLEPITSSFALPKDRVLDTAVLPEGKYRLSRFAYLRREGDDAVLETPRSAARVRLHNPAVFAAVLSTTTPATLQTLCEQAGGVSDDAVHQLVRLLETAQILTPVDAAGDSDEQRRPELAAWEFHDLLFHSRSRLGRHDLPCGGYWPMLARQRGGAEARSLPAVPDVAGKRFVELHRPDLEQLQQDDPPFAQVMEQRRSIREYDPQPITAEQFGEFLFRVARIREEYTLEQELPEGRVTMEIATRPYPTGGGMCELEIYPIVKRCDGLEPGLYHYDARRHRLALLSEVSEQVDELVFEAAANASVRFEDVQILLNVTARFQRLSAKYGAIAYCLILKNVGVLFQTMYLAAAAMGLAPCAVGVGNADDFSATIGGD